MRGSTALRSGYRRRGAVDHGHPAASRLRAGAALLAGLVLAGCSLTRPAPAPPVAPAHAAPARPAAAGDPRILMIDQARSMIGQPYHWGGAAPGGFDCSGLVVYAAAGAGLNVPRTAHEQQRFGTPVSRDAVRAGDLVFLHLARKELHVGIALSNDRFIHAPSTGGYVRIDSLDAPVYAKAYLGARRIVAMPQ